MRLAVFKSEEMISVKIIPKKMQTIMRGAILVVIACLGYKFVKYANQNYDDYLLLMPTEKGSYLGESLTLDGTIKKTIHTPTPKQATRLKTVEDVVEDYLLSSPNNINAIQSLMEAYHYGEEHADNAMKIAHLKARTDFFDFSDADFQHSFETRGLPSKLTEVHEFIVIDDPFKEYREILTKNLPQVGNRMAQAYNLQVMLENLSGWELTKVIHSKTQSLQFYLSETSQSSIKELKAFAWSNDFVFLQDKQGTSLTTYGANVPVFEKNNPIMIYQISAVYQLLADALSTMIPNSKIEVIDYTKLDSTQKEWTTMRALIDFKSITKEDILKIRSITKYLPITLETGAYQVSKGRVSGSLILQIHGEEI